ncbi:hypothetical protein KI387_029146 [Taxus chinensis]|uniref:Uncharacterized protein n=1 Tax=Taxus chinensis TaxID=29808 RepID=A0AA38CJR2_TAXCH|nr:hypothetical protein KI387_029146 [Taxus chinensis]
MGLGIAFETDKLWITPDSVMCIRWEEDEEEETLSLCDLVTERGAFTGVGLPVEREAALRESSPGSSHRKEFDFDLGRSSSTAYNICPADDLFHQGRLLPLAHFPYSKSNSTHENRLLLNEKVQAWRTDSQTKGYYSASHKNLQQGNLATSTGDSSTSKQANRKTKSPSSASKTGLKWQQLLTPGLIKTPPMKMEDIRLKQVGNPNNNRADNSFLKRSVSSNYQEGQMFGKMKLKTVNFQQKSKSVKENLCVKETPTSRGWRSLAPLNRCTSMKSVESPLNIGRGSAKSATSRSAIFGSTATRSKWIFPKLFCSIF